jgi:hypothetical protein
MMNQTQPTAVNELERLQRRVRRRVLIQGGLNWVAVAVPALSVAVWLAGGEHLRGGFIATVLSVSVVAVLAGAAVHHLWRPWRRYAGRRAFAQAVEARGTFGNVVIAAEEAVRRPERWPVGDAVARELIRRLDASALAALASLTPAKVHPAEGQRWRWASLAVGVALAIALAVGWPATGARGLALLLDPRSAGGRSEGGLYAEPAAPWVVVGGRITLAASDFAADPIATHCEVRFGDAAWTKIGASPAPPSVGASAPGNAAGLPPAFRRWLATVTDVREDFSWRFRRGGTVTAVGKVVARQPPLLNHLAATVEPPAYMGLPTVTVERLPSLSEVPAGSRVTLTGQAGHDLAAAWLATDTGDSLPMRVNGARASVALTISDDAAFTVRLRDGYGLESRDPLGYRITALADHPPSVTLVRPQDDGQLPLDGKVTLLVEATDDFGLRRLALWAAAGDGEASADPLRSGGGVAPGVAFGPPATGQWQTCTTAAGDLRLRARALAEGGSPLRAAMALEIEAGDLNLVAGDVLELAVEARDNRAPGDGQTARSAVLRLALPSAAAVLAAQAESAEESREDLEEARRRGRQLDADLQRLTRELMKNPVPDWARQQEIEAALERQQALQRELARVAEELRRQIEELARGQLTSEAQLERTEQMAELLAPPSGQQLAELLEKLAQPGGQVAPDEVTRAMDEVAREQKDQARRLDAALALLRRLADEQKLEGLTSLLEDMMRKQQELADLSREMSGAKEPSPAGEPQDGEQPPPDGKMGESESQAAELARRQEALARELEQLSEKLEQALAEQQESSPSGQEPKTPPSPQEQALREALDKMKQQQASKSMDKASRMLEQMDPQQAAQMQQQALRDLGSLYSVLLASQQAMQAAMKMGQVSSLRGLAADLLALSARQEELGARIPVQLQDVRNLELTRQQHRLQKAAVGTRDRLAELMEEAPNRILKLLEKLDALVEEMGGGIRALDEGRAAAAREHASRSLAAANRIVIGLLTEAQMSGSGGGSGSGGQPQSASEQLQEMARQQAEMNGATEELRRMLADRGISQQARSQMQRLGQQQAELGQELSRLAEQERQRPAGDGQRLLGDMQELGRQMERVGGDLGAGQVDQEVLQRQDRILGRLLDARNSVRERDYSSRRESRAATRTFLPQDGEVGRGEGDRESNSRQRYQRLENAPLEYRELVRRYFAAIDSLQRSQTGRDGAREGVLP